jgi:hypothetical protein
MSRRLKPCDRCGRRVRTLAAMAGWNVVVKSGYITGLLCPSCQTPEENAEAATNEATLDFAVINGRLVGSPKGVG